MDLQQEVARRRTFAIISHPDAGKTTMTEKLLLYGGAVHQAGSVKSRKAARHAVSDWMEMEKEKGISITSSVLQFDYMGRRLNLLDTPGHADFSEDTYRTLAAVDSAIMLMDGAKGVEARTLRLFEVCRMRRLPILTFINKWDRPGLDPMDLLSQVANTLNIRTVPLNWPIGSGSTFQGILDRRTDKVTLFERTSTAGVDLAAEIELDLDDASLPQRIGSELYDQLLEDHELLQLAGDDWSEQEFLDAKVTPFFFGSAMTNYGVGPFLRHIVELAPPPRPRESVQGFRAPSDPDFSGFIFKIQANMNRFHRDRIAFMRVVSGKFERNMEVTLARTGASMRLSKPHTFLASERSIVDDAVPGDIVGLYDPGELRIGDTLATGDPVTFQGIPRFAPEYFARIRLKDPTRRKHLQRGLQQLSQEGTIQLFTREGLGSADPYLGAVGLLQFEVLKERLKIEYNVEAALESAPFRFARWIAGDPKGMEWLEKRSDYLIVADRHGHPVLLTETLWPLNYALQEAPGLKLLEVSPMSDDPDAQ